MRTTRTLLTLLALTGGAGGASASLSLPVDREVGTLTCALGTEPSLGARSEASVECVFVSDRDEAAHTYAGRLHWQRGGALAPVPARIVWRVLTRKGVERPGMLGGAYADPATWQVAPVRAGVPILLGPAAKLRQRTALDTASVVEPQPVVEIELSPVAAVAAR